MFSFFSEAMTPVLQRGAECASGCQERATVAAFPETGRLVPQEQEASLVASETLGGDYYPAPRSVVKKVRGLPEIDYPSPLVVKNTFIEADLRGLSSLDGFLEVREIRSCPSSGVCGIPAGTGSLTPLGEEEWHDAEEEPENETADERAPVKPVRESRPLEADGSAKSRSTSAGESSPQSMHSDAETSLGVVTPGASPTLRDDAVVGGLPADDLPAYVFPASRPVARARPGLPEFDYPSPFSIKNTFIHTGIAQPVSLDGFYQEREIRSCPVSGAGSILESVLGSRLLDPIEDVETSGPMHALDGLLDAAAVEAACVPQGIPPPPIVPPMLPMLQPAQELPMVPPPPLAAPVLAVQEPRSMPPPPPQQAPVLPVTEPLFTPPGPLAVPMTAPAVMPAVALPETLPVLQPAFQQQQPPPLLPPAMLPHEHPAPGHIALDQLPFLGSPALPTRGSAMHHFGDCKPCAYAFHKGCGNGVDCQFCHLCPPGELKRRQKVKRSTQRMQQATLRSGC
jgi:hypothetical protein